MFCVNRRPSRPPLMTLRHRLRLRYPHFPTSSLYPLPLSPMVHPTPRKRCLSQHRTITHPACFFARIDSCPRFFFSARSLFHLLHHLRDRNSGFIMSICFTICLSVSLLLLVFKKRSPRHDGAYMVSISHAHSARV
jgi:hypothetical protein